MMKTSWRKSSLLLTMKERTSQPGVLLARSEEEASRWALSTHFSLLRSESDCRTGGQILVRVAQHMAGTSEEWRPDGCGGVPRGLQTEVAWG